MQPYPKTTSSQALSSPLIQTENSHSRSTKRTVQHSFYDVEPSCLDSEQWLIGAALADAATVMPRLKDARVTRAWFHDLRHQTLFSLIDSLYQDGRPGGPVAVQRQASDLSFVEQIGGTGYLADCFDRFESIENFNIR